MRFLVYLGIGMLAKRSIPMILGIRGVLVGIVVSMKILDNVCTYVALTVTVGIGVSSNVCPCNHVSAVSGIPVISAVGCPAVRVGVGVVGEFADVANAIVISIDVIELLYGCVIAFTG
jgi:hypothetical protein